MSQKLDTAANLSNFPGMAGCRATPRSDPALQQEAQVEPGAPDLQSPVPIPLAIRWRGYEPNQRCVGESHSLYLITTKPPPFGDWRNPTRPLKMTSGRWEVAIAPADPPQFSGREYKASPANTTFTSPKLQRFSNSPLTFIIRTMVLSAIMTMIKYSKGGDTTNFHILYWKDCLFWGM